MVKYIYDKYNTISTAKWVSTGLNQISWLGEKLIAYEYALVNNVFHLVNPFAARIDGTSLVGKTIYLFHYNDREDVLLRVNVSSRSGDSYEGQTALASNTEAEYSRGILVQSNIQAEDGTYPTDGRHTDGFWYVRKGVANQNPVITPSTIPSGSTAVKPSFNYTVSDPDGNAMTVTESIDGIVFNTRTAVASGTQLTYTPSDLAWLRTRIKQAINITITANDGNGGVTTVNYPITRTTPAIDMQLKTPFETDVAAKRLLLRLEGNIPSDAVVNVQACNNAFDASPTWENATNLVLSGFPYPFTNKLKTATKWGISFKVRIERGSSTQAIYLDGLGGAFD